jgi:PTS system mannitol-specific IIA component
MKNILTTEKIMLNAKVANKEEAIRLTGELLVRTGHVTASYVEKMQEREGLATTYIGSGVAIPHGTNEAKADILSTGISVVQVPDGVDFGEGNVAYLLVGIAAVGDEHLEVLSNIAILCSEEENVKRIVHASSAEEIIAMFTEEV